MKFSRDNSRTGGVGDPETTDLDRRVQDAIKFGEIAEVDLEREPPSYRVLIGDKNDDDNHIITDWIPANGGRASEEGESEAHFLEKGEKVVLLTEGGELATAQVLPAATFTKKNKAPTKKPGEWKRKFKNGAVVGYDRETGELTLDATNATGKVTLRSKDGAVRMSNGKVTVQTGSKAKSTGPSSENASMARTLAAVSAQNFDLNQQMKGLHARIEQAEHTISAQHFATSLLHNLLLPTNPQIAGLLAIFNQAPGGMEKMVQMVTGLLPGYAQSLLKLAMGKFQLPTMDSIGDMMGNFIQGQITQATSQIASLVTQQSGITSQIADIERQITNLEGGGEQAAGQLAGLVAQKAGLSQTLGQITSTIGDLKGILDSANLAAPAEPDFMGSQKNIVKGMIESVRFGGLGKQD